MDELDEACQSVQDEIIRLRTQLRFAQSSEGLWSTRYADLARTRDRLSHALNDVQERESRWELVAREMQDERDDMRSENIRLRRLVGAFLAPHTNSCRFDHDGDCQEHTSVGQYYGACAVAIARAWLHE